MKLKLYTFSAFLLVASTVFAETTANLPANSRIFSSEKDCIEVIRSQYSWNIEFAASLREMQNRGKMIRYPHKIPITIMETKNYKIYKYYKISIYDNQTKQHNVVWTDAVRFE